MADVKQTIKIKEIVDVRDAIHGIEEIQGALGKLQLKPDVKAGFDKIFQDIERQAEKANTAMATGFKNKGDVKRYTDALQGINRGYDALILRIEKLKGQKDLKFNFDTQEVKNIKSELESLSKVTEQVAAQTKAAGDALGKSLKMTDIKNRRRADKGGQWADIFNNLNPENLEKAIKKIEELREKADKSLSENKATSYWTSVKNDLNEIQGEIDQYNSALQAQSDAQDKVTKKTEELNTAMHNVGGELDVASNAAKNGAKEFGNYAKSGAEAAQSSQRLSSELEHFKDKAAYFFGLANGINLFKRALRSAYETVKDLDKVMTETAVVTNFDVGDMWKQLPEYTQRANELGVSIHSAYEAATIFYQQGLKTNEVMAVSNETLKMARIAGLDAATASDRMTNALRGFNMEMDKVSAQRVNDVYSKLAAITASNTDEISTAMTKVASLAHNANMEFETTSAFLAQMIETTRESAETAGTALKTVVARFSEVKKLYSKGELMGQDEEGGEIDVNKVSTALRSAGINLNEYLTGAKGLDDIFIELASKWDSLDKVQQRYIATMAAGSRQQSRFIAMMSDYKRTTELVSAANNANGASQEQYSKTLESLETKLARLKNAWNEFVLGLANSDAIKAAVDMLTKLITVINSLIKSVSGKNAGVKMVTSFFTAFATFKVGQKLFGKTTLGNFFGGLVKNAEGESSKGAIAIAKNFYANLSTSIADYKKKGGIIGSVENTEARLSSGFTGLQNYFTPQINPQTQEKIIQDMGVSNLDTDKLLEFCDTLQKGNLSIDELNQALAKTGSTLQINEQNFKKYGITWTETDKKIGQGVVTMKAFSAAVTVVGGAMAALGSKLEQTEDWKEFGTVIKVLGTGLMTFGTIMSVYLPLQAQLMAKEVTGAIVSIPIVGWIAAIISALIALGAAVNSYAKNYSLEAKLNKAAEAAKAASEAATEAKEAYEKLGEAWKSLDDKYDAIQNATQGTQEWRDAIREVNDAVLELMNTYKNVEVKRDENGILRITNRKEIDDKMRGDALNSEAAERFAKVREIEAGQNKIDDTELKGHWGEGIKGYTEFLNEYIKLGKLNELASMTDDEITKLVKEYKDKHNNNPISEEYIKNNHYPEAIRDYAKNTRANEESKKAQITALGSTALSKAEISKELQPYANTLLSGKYLEDLVAKSRKEFEGRDHDKIREKWAQDKYGTSYSQFKASNPEDKTTIEQMTDYLAGERAIGIASEQIKAFTANLAKLTPAQKALVSGQNGENLSQFQLANLKYSSKEDKEKLFSNLGGADAFGSYDAFEKWLQDLLDKATANFDTSKFSREFVHILDTGLIQSLDSGTYKKFLDNLWSVYGASGKEGVDSIQNSIKNMAEEANMSSEDLKNFIKSIDSIDWTSSNSIHTLSDLAKEYGISEDKANELEEQIIKLNNAATKVDLNKVTNQLKSLLGLGKKINIGTQGRNFSEEQKNQLIEAGVDASKFVYNIETGEYNYTGVLQEILSAVQDLVNKTFDTEQLEKDIASGTAAKELINQGEPQNNEDKIAFVRDYMLKAGNNSKISTEMLKFAADSARNKDYSVVDKLITIIQNEAKALPERQNELDNYEREKEVMQRQLQYGFTNAVDANNGDKEAQEALQAQISGTGLSEELKQRFLTNISNGNKEDTTQAGNIVDTFDQARANGISAEDLNAYADALQRVEGLENKRIDELYAMALAEAKYQEGMKSLVSTYNQWSKFIGKDGNFKIPQPDTADFKVYEKMKEDLAKMLNSSEKIPDEFFEADKNAELLQRAVKQDKKAVAELAAKLAKSNIGKLGMGFDKEGKKKDLDKEVDDYLQKIQTELPDLKIGATFDEGDAEVQLAQLLSYSGKTVDEINKIMGNMGMSMQWEPKTVNLQEYAAQHQGGYITVPDEKSSTGYKTVPVDNYSTADGSSTVQILVPKKATFNKPPKINPPKTTKKSRGKKGGGGGGKKAKKKKERWENPYDELYNLQEKINESLRKREALERRYQKLLKQEQTSLSDIRKSYYDQIKQIRTEANLQKELEAGRLRQINNIGKQTYVDSKGKVKTFDQMGVTKYAKYNKETGAIEIKWEEIQALQGTKNVEKGKAVEAYISKLEELVQSYEEVRDKLWELEDKIEEYRQAVIDTFLSFEDRVMDAVVNKYQKEIDSYQAMSDAIDKVNNEVLSSLREQIDLSRQIRDNTKKEEDISKKENRLAYLRRDTSGANDLEILSLEKELKEARESYGDTLVDQAIDKMQDDASKASEQRQRQIETMQAQLDIAKETGALWQKVYTLMSDAAKSEIFSEDSELAKLLKDGEAWKSLSNIGQAKWWEEVGKSFREAIIGRDEAEDKYKTDADNNGTVANTGTSQTLKDISESNTQANVTADTYDRTDEQNYGAAAAIIMGGKTHGGWGANRDNWKNNLKEKGFDPGAVLDIYDIFVKQKADWDKEQTEKQKAKGKYKKGKKKGKWKYTKQAWTGWKTMGVTDWTKYQMSRFETGGLADKTGPAWLDGTKTKPELVLNAKDTRNFIALKDILASLMNTQKTGNKTSTGNNYFDIDIHADIGSDYDVDKLANRLKKIIFEDGQYRNVNTINLLR